MNIAMDSDQEQVQAVLDFWFGSASERGKARTEWFRKDQGFDEAIRARFLGLRQQAVAGSLEAWRTSPRSCLALIVVLDQFSRNLFRGSAEAFAGDARALEAARHACDSGFDLGLLPVERQFIYLPFEHCESLAEQDRCCLLMESLRQYPETADLHVWAEKHRVIIRRFGRFPHRNAALGRASTPEEIEFLKTPGSGF
ncbi:MAG TPA: DUF924 family protein [Usitatibacteraceae bacterium]|nr:DUF924 family protein [Usitatibacteraceae bacterium]